MNYDARTVFMYATGLIGRVHDPALPCTMLGAIGIAFEDQSFGRDFTEAIPVDERAPLTEQRAHYWAILRALESAPRATGYACGHEIHILTASELCAVTLTLCKDFSKVSVSKHFGFKPSNGDLVGRIVREVNQRKHDTVYFICEGSRAFSGAENAATLAERTLHAEENSRTLGKESLEEDLELLSVQSETTQGTAQ